MPLNIDFQQIFLHLLNFTLLFAILYYLLYKPVKDFMAKREAYYADMDKEARTIALNEYKKKHQSIEKLLYKNFRYKEQTFIYDMICKDVEKIWAKN